MEYVIKIISTIIVLVNGTIVNHLHPMINVNEKNDYVFNGNITNNYIVFNHELWRIMAVHKRDIQIIRNHSVGNMPFDIYNSNNWNLSSLKKYLNSIYLNTINTKYQKLIQTNDNPVTLISIDDYLKANSNQKLCGSLDLYFKNDGLCRQTNYIDKIANGQPLWTISSDDNEHIVYYVGATYFGDSQAKYEMAIYPSLHLKKNIKLNGQGTINNPYKIVF